MMKIFVSLSGGRIDGYIYEPMQEDFFAQTEEYELSVSRDAEGVISPVLTAKRDVCLCRVEFVFDIPLIMMGDLYYYNAKRLTNDVTFVVRHKEEPRAEMRDLILLKNREKNRCFNLGLVTAHRFYTCIRIDEGTVRVDCDLEDKKVGAGKELRLERFIYDTRTEKKFLSDYADTVARLNGARPLRRIPVGFCSWSRYFSHINEKNMGEVMEDMGNVEGTNLIQLDDGWQKGDSFYADWHTDTDKFTKGMNAVAADAKAKGLDFGLWLAPLLITHGTDSYEAKQAIVKNEVIARGALSGSYQHPFDLDHPDYYQWLMDIFQRASKKYGATYFKLDFLEFAIHSHAEPRNPITYESDYRSALIRKAFMTIREAVGEDAVLLSCGAPILECAGIFDAQRVSCDIVWGKNKKFPSHWQLIQNVTKTVLYRSFYHGKVFLNDADGLVVRDTDLGDGFDLNYAEARFLATMVACSGGSVLLNEEYRNLSPARKKLFDELIPPLGISARPVDFFEVPAPSAAVIEVDEHTRFLALFHLEDRMVDLSFELSELGLGEVLAVDCWNKKLLGVTDRICLPNVMPHSAELILLKDLPEKPEFLYSDVNLWLGQNLFENRYTDGTLTVKQTADCKKAEKSGIYAVYPRGCELPQGAEKVYEDATCAVVRTTAN